MAIRSLGATFSPRRKIDHEHIHRLAQTTEPLPPILVHRTTNHVIDGVHRLIAAMLNGRQDIEVTFFDGSEDEAFIRAVEENVAHGLPLPLADRRAAAIRIIATRPQLSDRVIAKHTGLAAKTVAALRRRSSEDPQNSNTRVGADGRVRPLNAAEGRRRAAQMIEQHPDAPVREIARMAGVSVGTAHDVRGRLRRGENPVPTPRPRAFWESKGTKWPAAPETGERPCPMDVAPMLRRLAKDPALRHNDPGRELLRLLHALALAPANWTALVNAVPPHCAEPVALIARRYAEIWSGVAHTLEKRADAGH